MMQRARRGNGFNDYGMNESSDETVLYLVKGSGGTSSAPAPRVRSLGVRIHFSIAVTWALIFLISSNTFLLQNRKTFDDPVYDMPNSSPVAAGIFVQGMHRSGTSLLTSIFISSGAYDGGPKDEFIPPRKHNSKGYFENILFVKQNIKLLASQGFSQVGDPIDGVYNSAESIVRIENGAIDFSDGLTLLRRWNTARDSWIVKDPRIALTMKTWHYFLNRKPAVIFTCRHPLEVIHSLAKQRQNRKPPRLYMKYGIEWAMYNEAIVSAIKSLDVCYVMTNNANILQDPLKESNRIMDELKSKCNVQKPSPSFHITNLTGIVDTQLNHNRHNDDDDVCHLTDLGVKDNYEFVDRSSNKTYNFSDKEGLQKLMRVYCDIQSGEVFSDGYEWPRWK